MPAAASSQSRHQRVALHSSSLFWRVTALKWLLVLLLCVVVSYVHAGPVPAPAPAAHLLPLESDQSAVVAAGPLPNEWQPSAAVSIVRSTFDRIALVRTACRASECE